MFSYIVLIYNYITTLKKYEKKIHFHSIGCPFNPFIFQDSCVGDIDFPWQNRSNKMVAKNYLKKN